MGEELAKRAEKFEHELTERDNAKIDEYKANLWARVNELMENDDYTNQADFDFKLSAWVQHLCIVEPVKYRELILQASDEIQVRFYMVLSAGIKAGMDEGSTGNGIIESTEGEVE